MARNTPDAVGDPPGPGSGSGDPPDPPDAIYFIVRRLSHQVDKLNDDLQQEKLWHADLNLLYAQRNAEALELEEENERKQTKIDDLQRMVGLAEGKASSAEIALGELRKEAGELRDQRTTSEANANSWKTRAGTRLKWAVITTTLAVLVSAASIYLHLNGGGI